MSNQRYQEGPVPNSPSVASPMEAQLPAVSGHYYPPAERAPETPLSPPFSPEAQQEPKRPAYQAVSSSYAKTGPQHPLSNETYAGNQNMQGSSDDIKEDKTPFLRGDSTLQRLGNYASYGGTAHASSYNGTDPSVTQARKRVGYLDGLKFIAAWVVLNGTVLDNTIPDDSYSAIQRSSPLYIFRSTNLGFTALLILSGRSLLEPLWNRASPANPDSRTAINWFKTSRSLLTRPFRFILPVLVVVAAQWGLGATGQVDATSQVGMQTPAWSEIRNWSGYCTLVFDLFSQWFVMDTNTAKTFGANLWFNPWIFDSSYCAYVTHLMLGNLSSNRYWVYMALWFFSWTSYTFFAVTTIGVAICDLAVHGRFAQIQEWNFLPRLALQLSLVAIALVFQWVNVVRDNVNYGMGVISVLNLNEVTFCDMLFVTCGLLVVETSPWCQMVFGNIVMRMLGKLSAGMVLLSPILVFSAVPQLALDMNASDVTGSTTLGVGWLVVFLASCGLAVIFYLIVEMPSKIAGDYFAEFCLNWGKLTEEEKQMQKNKADVKAPNSAPAKLKQWFL